MVTHSETTSNPEPASPLDERAVAILRQNDRGGYTVPTDGLYPHQWNWDSAFVALGFATFDMDRAIKELESLFEAQWPTGMVPQIAFRSDDSRYFPGPSVWQTHRTPGSSGITQPPVAASIGWSLWQKTSEKEHRQRLHNLLSKMAAWHRWFRTERDPDGLGLAVIIHPWESGRDNSPEWDAPAAAVDVSKVEPYQRRDLDHAEASMRPRQLDYDRYMALVQYGRDCGWDQPKIAKEGPFRVADVGINMMLLRADRDLAAWAEAAGEPALQAEVEGWIQQRQTALHQLWDPAVQSFCSRDLASGASSGFVTSGSFLAFYAGVATAEQTESLVAHWDRLAEKVAFMVPSFDPDHALFDAQRYWRGPCWAVVNYMIAKGLSEGGLHDRARHVRADTRAMIEQNGFFEAFSPVDGTGTGGRDFSWTAAMWLAWAAQTD